MNTTLVNIPIYTSLVASLVAVMTFLCTHGRDFMAKSYIKKTKTILLCVINVTKAQRAPVRIRRGAVLSAGFPLILDVL